MRSSSGSAFSALALAAFALSMVAALPLASVHVGRRLSEAVAARGEDARAARVRLWGGPVVEAFDAIRQVIPEDGEYLLVDGGEEWNGTAYWVRFELAPRRARFAGRLSAMPGVPTLPPSPQWVVVAIPYRPPLLLDRDEFLRQMRQVEADGAPR